MIHVTQEDIDKGCPTDGRNCPVARAVLRRLRELGIKPDGHAGFTELSVLGDEIKFVYRDVVYRYATTERAADFVCDFDLGNPVKPFSFKAKRVSP